MIAILSILRYKNLLISAFVILGGFYIAHFYKLRELILSLLSVISIQSFGYLHNDLLDIEIDKISHPKRPLPQGILHPNSIRMMSLSLLLIGLITAYFIGTGIFLFSLFSSVLLWLYNTKLKRLAIIGNATVALLGGFVFLFVGMVSGNLMKMLFPFLFAFLIHFAREICKDIIDMEGDKILNFKTLPVVIGPNPSLFVVKMIVLVLILLTPIPYFLNLFNEAYLILVNLTVNLPLLWIILRKDIRANMVSPILKFEMVLGLLSLAIGR